MSEAEFAAISVKILVGALILYMGYIMYRLGKDSKAGRFGAIMIFFLLGFGMAGFIFKEVAIQFMG